MAITYKLITTVTVGSSGAANITFSNIPQTYTDLILKLSSRSNVTDGNDPYDLVYTLNSTSTITSKVLRGDTATSSTNSITDRILRMGPVPSNWGSNNFNNSEIYLSNYTTSNFKAWSADGVVPNNGTGTAVAMVAGLTSISVPVTTIIIAPNAGNFVQHSSAYLYGIKNS